MVFLDMLDMGTKKYRAMVDKASREIQRYS